MSEAEVRHIRPPHLGNFDSQGARYLVTLALYLSVVHAYCLCVARREFPGAQWELGSLPDEVNRGEWGSMCAELVSRPSHEGLTHALVVVCRGRVVHEWYGEGFSPTSTHISWSMAKSILHALVGIAVREGILSVTDSHLMPEWEHDDRASITVHDLLTMRSGLSWTEDYVDNQVSDVIRMLFGESDFTGNHAAYAAHQPLLHTPGTQWVYSSGTTNILARVLARALGEKAGEHSVVERFMQQHLFGPIGMTATPKFDASGTFVASSFVYATARDFLRFGYLYLADGMWGDTQILPGNWTNDAQRTVVIDPETTMGYSTQWWTWPSDEGSMIAHGYEGQVMWVSPRRDVVVLHLGKTPAEFGALLRQRLHTMVSQFPVRA